jgi:hypothetical protein
MSIWYILWSFGKFLSIWYILRSFDLFFGRLVYFVAVWYIFPVLVYCAQKNLATLITPVPPKSVRSSERTSKLRSLPKFDVEMIDAILAEWSGLWGIT